MKNTNSKSFKQYQINSNKRSISPLLASQQQLPLQSNSNPKSAKKKLTNNSPYQKAMRQFQTYGKAQRKKNSNLIQSESKQQHNKFRIVTEPVDDRIMHLAQSNIFNSSLAIKHNKRIDTQVGQQSGQIRLNLRQSNNSQSRSRDRLHSNANANRNVAEADQSAQKSGERSQNRSKSRLGTKCKNCMKFTQQLEYLNAQIKRLTKTKQLWRSGQITYEQAQQIYSSHKQQNLPSYHQIKSSNNYNLDSQKQGKPSNVNPYSHNSLQNLGKNIQLQRRSSINNPFKFADSIINMIKYEMADLIAEIQSLTFIDYPKMLQMHIFKYQPTYNDYIDVQQNQLKQLFGQLRSTIEGKIIDYDTYDTQSQNNYVKMIMKNLKSRLSSCLRQNLQLRICKAIYQKSQQISQQSQEYLRKVIEQVLESYASKTIRAEKDKTKTKEKEKEKEKNKALKK